MPRWKPTRCRDCKTREGHISLRGFCEACGRRRMMGAAVELTAKEGEIYEAWRERMAQVMPGHTHRL